MDIAKFFNVSWLRGRCCQRRTEGRLCALRTVTLSRSELSSVLFIGLSTAVAEACSISVGL
ncbi:hypothetical protein BGW80DRAFT_1298248, partial [Lactifluus volemus]